MKTITIRLPDVEAAMLDELVKRSQRFHSVQDWIVARIRDAYLLPKR